MSSLHRRFESEQRSSLKDSIIRRSARRSARWELSAVNLQLETDPSSRLLFLELKRIPSFTLESLFSHRNLDAFLFTDWDGFTVNCLSTLTSRRVNWFQPLKHWIHNNIWKSGQLASLTVLTREMRFQGFCHRVIHLWHEQKEYVTCGLAMKSCPEATHPCWAEKLSCHTVNHQLKKTESPQWCRSLVYFSSALVRYLVLLEPQKNPIMIIDNNNNNE